MKKTLIILLLSLVTAVLVPSIVKADGNSGGSGGGANVVGCGTSSFVCTNYGSQWRWYSTEGASNPNNIDIDGGREYMNGYGTKNPSYARGDINVTGCGDVGGYWRYGFVAFRPKDPNDSKWFDAGTWYGRYYDAGYWMYDWNYSFGGNRVWWQVGEQVGMMAIGGNGSADYRSEFFSGGKNLYIGNNWYTVRDLYLRAKKYDQSKYSHEWNSASNLAWFCYAGKSFDAKASVGDSSTDWIIGSNESGEDIKDSGGTTMGISCGSDDGCDTEFKFDLRKVYSYSSSYNSTDFFIQKQSNGTWNRLEEFAADVTSTPSDSGTNVYSVTEKIKPSETICYRIGYKPHGSFNTTTYRYVQACGYNLGNFKSEIDIKVKKSDEEEWGDEVYAKPGDTINMLGTYTPRAQSAANLTPNTVIIRNGGSSTNSGKNLINTFNELLGPTTEWKNAFAIRLDNENGEPKVRRAFEYAVDECKKQCQETLNYGDSNNGSINYADVGKKYVARAITNDNDETKTTPKEVTVDLENGSTATVDTSSIESTGNIIIPYNFKNSTEINKDTVLYAGEEASIKYSVIVGQKRNIIVEPDGGEYATIVRGAKWELQMEKNGEWMTIDSGDGDLNKSGKLEGDLDPHSSTITVPDKPAGTVIKFRSRVCPANSGEDTNLDSTCKDDWTGWEPADLKIAKRPSLQVWGGNIYSSGTISTKPAVKKKYYNPESNNQDKMDTGTFVFGSWGELGVISNKEVRGLASGAGYALNKGAGEDSFCFVSTLSFANSNCSGDTVGNFGVSLGSLDSDKNTVINKLENSGIEPISIDNVPSEINENTGILYVKGESIEIAQNIIYGGSYTTLESIPKVVIYATGDVNIQCDVTRIDALIIANGTVNTCYSEKNELLDINDGLRSHQLRITGAVVTNKLKAERTYGAGVGEYSGIPAEIINFDSSLYLWGGNEAKNDESVYTMSSYTRELAPRY